MRKLKNTLLLLLALSSVSYGNDSLLLASASAPAQDSSLRGNASESEPKASQAAKKSFITNWFQFLGGAVFDSEGGFSGVTGVSWIPTFLLSENWRLRASIGAMMANVGSGSGFFVGDGNLMLVYTEAKPLTVEIGGGGQYWDGRRNFHPQMRAGLGYRLPAGSSFLHSIQVYYTRIFTPVVSSHQVMAGFSVRF